MQEPQTKLPDPMQSKFAQVINVKWIFSLQLTIKKRSLDRFSIFLITKLTILTLVHLMLFTSPRFYRAIYLSYVKVVGSTFINDQDLELLICLW